MYAFCHNISIVQFTQLASTLSHLETTNTIKALCDNNVMLTATGTYEVHDELNNNWIKKTYNPTTAECNIRDVVYSQEIKVTENISIIKYTTACGQDVVELPTDITTFNVDNVVSYMLLDNVEYMITCTDIDTVYKIDFYVNAPKLMIDIFDIVINQHVEGDIEFSKRISVDELHKFIKTNNINTNSIDKVVTIHAGNGRIVEKVLKDKSPADTKEYTLKLLMSGNFNDIHVLLASKQTNKPQAVNSISQAICSVQLTYNEFIIELNKKVSAEQMMGTIEVLRKATFDNWLELSNEIYIKSIKSIKSTKPLDILQCMYDVNDISSRLSANYIADKAMHDLSRLLDKKIGKTVKNLTNHPIGLAKNTYKTIYPPINWLLGAKADGNHVLLFINKGKAFLIEAEIEELHADNIPHKTYIFEGEQVTINGEKQLLIFDVLYYESKSLLKSPAKDRIEYIDKALPVIHSVYPNASNRGWTIITEDLKSSFDSVYNKLYSYNIDGLILMSPDDEYFNTTIYKWKPAEKLTIDFYVMECPSSYIGKAPYISKPGKKIVWLCCGIAAGMFIKLNKYMPRDYPIDRNQLPNYFPLPFMPATNPTAYVYYVDNADIIGKVVEMLWTGNSWTIERVRTERTRDIESGKYFGNDYRIAEITWMMIQNPLTYEGLYNSVAASYFQDAKADRYKAPTAYNSFIKSTLIEHYCKNKTWVIDFAAGKGQDIGRYARSGVKHITVIDNDQDAISEYILRMYEFRTRVKDTTAIVGDLNNPIDILKKIEDIRSKVPLLDGKQANVIICNFAIHYFLEHILELAAIINTLLVPGGKFVFTCFDGKKIFDLLKDMNQGESWTQLEDGQVKYKIEKRYKGTEFQLTGQKIGVLLPFSNGELYEEELVNFTHINSILLTAGFRKEIHNDFNPQDFSSTFKVSFPPFINDLTSADKQFVSLYSYLIYSKVGKDNQLSRELVN